MFGLDVLGMMGTYEQRKVANDEINGATIDTCAVTDSDQPYETGICSKEYNDGEWVIVEMYETKELAEIGHAKWVDTFTNNKPESLEDVSTSGIKKLLNAFSE